MDTAWWLMGSTHRPRQTALSLDAESPPLVLLARTKIPSPFFLFSTSFQQPVAIAAMDVSSLSSAISLPITSVIHTSSPHPASSKVPQQTRQLNAAATAPVMEATPSDAATTSDPRKACWNRRSHLLEPATREVGIIKTICWNQQGKKLQPLLADAGTSRWRSCNHY